MSLGDVMVDVYFRLPDSRNPRTDTVGTVELSGGGSAANFAVWIGRHGRRSALIGRVGADFVGRAMAAEFEAEGVEPHLVFDPQCGTGRVGVLTAANGERDMVCDRRANTRLVPEDVSASLIATAEWVHVSGYAFFEDGPARAARRCIELAVDASVPVSVDPAAYSFIRRISPAAMLKLCRGASVILPNLDEGMAMTGLADPERIASALLKHFPVVALKLGADGCLGMSRIGTSVDGHHLLEASDDAIPARTLSEGDGRTPCFVRLAAEPAVAVDTTGAGDAFDAGFVLACSSGAGLAESLAAGNRLGAAVVSQIGARPRIGLLNSAGCTPLLPREPNPRA
ncbi:MAG: sugar kinase [Clostridia bacterium]|nr:sugar kinase [Clostridia bacterium]